MRSSSNPKPASTTSIPSDVFSICVTGIEPPEPIKTAGLPHSSDKAARALVFLSPVEADTTAALQDKGWQVLDFSEPEHWSKRFAEHPAVFGPAR